MNNSILDAIGDTPLVKAFHHLNKNIYAKLEYLNPGGSVKDRSAKYMIEHAEKRGKLKKGMTVIDASSGNQGIALAMVCAVKGYNCIIFTPEKTSLEKAKTVEAYGGKVVKIPTVKDLTNPQSYHSQAVKLANSDAKYFMPNQYFNTDNRQGHYESLGPEIWKQTEGKITHFIAAAGTGGHVSGVGQYLKEKNPKIKILAVDSKHSFRSTNGKPESYSIEGMGVDFDSPVLNKNIIDQFLEVEDADAIRMIKKMAQEEGIFAGASSGAVAHATISYAQNLKETDLAVIIMGDSGRAYLSKNWF